jgi:Mn2+/Fe2+ NRAMP family transporter
MISARLGRVTGRGLAPISVRTSRALLYALVITLLVASTINVAADVGAMGKSPQLVVGGPSQVYTVVIGVVCLALEFLSYPGTSPTSNG